MLTGIKRVAAPGQDPTQVNFQLMERKGINEKLKQQKRRVKIFVKMHMNKGQFKP